MSAVESKCGQYLVVCIDGFVTRHRYERAEPHQVAHLIDGSVYPSGVDGVWWQHWNTPLCRGARRYAAKLSPDGSEQLYTPQVLGRVRKNQRSL